MGVFMDVLSLIGYKNKFGWYIILSLPLGWLGGEGVRTRVPEEKRKKMWII